MFQKSEHIFEEGKHMKIDRLLSIIIHLLNHEITSAAKLAERFEVSRRTILRDIERISLAGIPIQSIPGANGGYSIMEGYKLDGQLVNAHEQASIITALQGLSSAYDGNRYGETLEKMVSILKKPPAQYIFFDFGATCENKRIQIKVKTLEKAIQDKIAVKILYVNAAGNATCRLVEPVALNYRWYAWYILAYCTMRQDYRLFKLARIEELESANMAFSRKHGNPASLLEQADQSDLRKSLNVTLLCKAEVKVQVCEYLDGHLLENLKNGDFIFNMHVVEEERMWFAILLSFGDKITVVEPEELKNQLSGMARKILSVYEQ